MNTVKPHNDPAMCASAQPKPRMPRGAAGSRDGRGGPLCARARRAFADIGLSALVQLAIARTTTDDAARLKAARTILTAPRRAVSMANRMVALDVVIALARSEATADRVRVEAIELLKQFGSHGRRIGSKPRQAKGDRS